MIRATSRPLPTGRRCRRRLTCGILGLVLISACLPARPFRPVEPIPAGIVDMHCHIAGIGAGGSGCWVSPRMRNNWRFKVYLRLMREFPNLYTDISALTQINKPGCLREALTRPEFAGRLLYGTDFPLINTALVSPWYSFRLSLRQKISIARTRNPWDRDVLMKHDLGVPTETFARSAQMFGRLM